ncbi:MAG TPA: hypothetical protein VJT33_16400 [bacterium]|nr:hypothetical protein [bacterium]
MSTSRTPGPPVEGFDRGALLRHRNYIKVATRSFPAGLIRRVLAAMDERRRTRRVGPEKAGRLPEMSLAELQREIAWRLGTLPPDDARAIAEFVRELAPRSPSPSRFAVP